MSAKPNDKTGAGRPRKVSDPEIFEALGKSISERGPAGYSLDDVAARLGLTGPALGYRFGSKHGLLIAFAAHQPDATSDHFAKVRSEADSPQVAIVEGLVSLTYMMTTRAEVANNMAMLSIDLSDKELAAHAKKQARIIKRVLAELLGECGLKPAATKSTCEDIYITWNGLIIAWAIDGTGSLTNWIRKRLTTKLDSLGL